MRDAFHRIAHAAQTFPDWAGLRIAVGIVAVIAAFFATGPWL